MNGEGFKDRPRAIRGGGDRYVFVDALRGIAAVGVLMDHVFYYRWLFKSAGDGTFGVISEVTTQCGACGVQMFFVISGFVITHSIRKTAPNMRGIGSFIIRRQLRLDPPYWAMITLVLLLAVSERFLSFIRHPLNLPTLGDLLLNLTYLHKIFDRTPILDVAWTLCIEVQFYLFFVLLLVLTSRVPIIEKLRSATVWAVFTTGVVFLAFNPAPGVRPWMVHYWPYFAAGVLSYWGFKRQMPIWMLPVFGVAFALSGAWTTYPACNVVGIATAGALYFVGRSGRLTSLWNGLAVQYLGRISYSLYLVHVPIAAFVLSVGYHLTHDTPASAGLWYFVAVLASLIFAGIFYRLIELPSMRFAMRLKNRSTAALNGDVDGGLVIMESNQILKGEGSL